LNGSFLAPLGAKYCGLARAKATSKVYFGMSERQSQKVGVKQGWYPKGLHRGNQSAFKYISLIQDCRAGVKFGRHLAAKAFLCKENDGLRDAGAIAGTAIAGFVRKGFPTPEYGRAQLGKSFRQQKVTVALFRAAQEERSDRSFAQERDKSIRNMTE
jgi:hypothetical protein